MFLSPNITRSELCTALGMVNSSLEEKYLGVPAIIWDNKKAVFAYIKEKVWRRLCGWNRKLLSPEGKEILLKAVAQAISSFVMSVFLLPTSLCMELERMMNSFWWGRNQKERKKRYKLGRLG